ncbi:MAG: acyl-ACP thioesterase [Spirochaetaceae bacterium]|jgi:acyl-ACP thioesterase|nr:acyl-ACP thioesterase [Spirochaetaceae bacterium]
MSVDVFAKNFLVTFRHIDRGGFLSPVAALDYLEEAAFSHAELLGVGYEAMMERRQVWILSRISVRMDKRPRLHENITVSSWPRGHDRLFAVRDYEIARDGQPLVRGRSDWIIFDLDKRRPIRPEEIMDRLPLNDGKNALTESPAALGEMEGLSHAATRKALYPDLDFNGHVHNTRYMQWICDLFDPEEIEKAPSISVDINYLREITALSVTELWFGETDGVYHIEGRQESGPVFRARVAFQSASPPHAKQAGLC